MALAYWSIAVTSGGLLLLFLFLRPSSADSRSLRIFVLVVLITAVTAYGIVVSHAGSVEIKGEGYIDWRMIGLLYFAMILGMTAQYFFYKSTRTSFRWNQFLKPFLASPIVFIPLLGSLEEARLNLDEFGLAKLMLLLVAFQNGFLWKVFFDTQPILQSKPKV